MHRVTPLLRLCFEQTCLRATCGAKTAFATHGDAHGTQPIIHIALVNF